MGRGRRGLERGQKNGIRQLIRLLFLAMVLASGSPVVHAAEGRAVTMRLKKTEGEVGISNAMGKSISLIEDMRLYNGYQVGTGKESYAWIAMDNVKLAKLDALSRTSFRKVGKKLEILLDSGFLFFNVSEPLEGAFMSCTSLTSMTIPEGVTSIGARAFESCSALANVTIPEGIKNIENMTFSYCYSLTNVVIPRGVTRIGYNVFDQCNSLRSMTIPNSVKECDSWFMSCSNLVDVYFGGSEEEWRTADIGRKLPDAARVHYNSSGPASASP